MLIDENGDKVGEVETKKALEMARLKGLDLVEVSPNSKPPVCKILEWSKFKYEQKKKRKESQQKGAEIKEVWFSAFIDQGDMQHKLKKVEEFISKKHPVKITIRAKGRVTIDSMKKTYDKIIEQLGDKIEIMQRAKREGRNYSGIIHYSKTTEKKSDDKLSPKADDTKKESSQKSKSKANEKE